MTKHYIAYLSVSDANPNYIISYGDYRDCFNESVAQYELPLSVAKELRSTNSVRVHYNNSVCFYGYGYGAAIHIIECNCNLYDQFGECETIQDIDPVEDF